MFDDILGVLERCEETFRGGVRDAFGASIIADVLDPIGNQIGLLRSFREDIQRHSLDVDQVLRDARSLTLAEGSQP